MADDSMPTNYDTQKTTTTTTETIGFHPEYVKTIPGILKIVEIVLCLITFICATANYAWTPYGGGWVQFVSMAAFIITIILFVFHLTNIILKLPGPWFMIVLSFIVFICASVKYFGGSGWVIFVALSAFITTLVALILYLLGMGRRWHLALLIEFIYYAVITLFFLISAIVCAARGYIPAVGAAAFFAFAATAVFAVDTFFQFREWRAGGGTVTRSTAATTTTTTTVESQPQY